MTDPLEPICRYVLHPDHNGLHLRQLAERMAAPESGGRPQASSRAQQQRMQAAAETVARFIRLVWGAAGPDEYAPRTFEILMGLQDRMRGMSGDNTWEYALSAFGDDIRMRLKKAGQITIDPEMETGLTHRFFDNVEEHSYLHDVAEKIMNLHWTRRHGPGAITDEEICKSPGVFQSLGDPEMERHLKRVALEGLATYIEQANIGRGHIDDPTDPTVLFRDRLAIQRSLGGKNAHTWDESGWRLADQIERRFGTRATRTAARQARAGWGASPWQDDDSEPAPGRLPRRR